MPIIPHCDELFQQYFVPWYSAESLCTRGFDSTRPDMLQIPDNTGKTAAELSPLQEGDQERFIRYLTTTMTAGAINDFGKLLTRSPPVDFSWIQTIDNYYHADRIGELISESDPADDRNVYLITCIELSVLIAKVMQELKPDLEWIADSPYWESSLWHPSSGYVLPTIHWAIKKISGSSRDAGLVLKIQAAMKKFQ